MTQRLQPWLMVDRDHFNGNRKCKRNTYFGSRIERVEFKVLLRFQIIRDGDQAVGNVRLQLENKVKAEENWKSPEQS